MYFLALPPKRLAPFRAITQAVLSKRDNWAVRFMPIYMSNSELAVKRVDVFFLRAIFLP